MSYVSAGLKDLPEGRYSNKHRHGYSKEYSALHQKSCKKSTEDIVFDCL